MQDHEFTSALSRAIERLAAAAPRRPMRQEPGFEEVYEAAISGVQTRFKHLSFGDIEHPPHAWFDAALARQLALHMLATEFDIPKRRIVERLQRSREALNRALETVDLRMESPEFLAAYEEMVMAARERLTAKDGSHE